MSFEVDTECACCGEAIRLTMASDLSHAVEDPTMTPLFSVPLVDFTKLGAPSIVDAF